MRSCLNITQAMLPASPAFSCVCMCVSRTHHGSVWARTLLHAPAASPTLGRLHRDREAGDCGGHRVLGTPRPALGAGLSSLGFTVMCASARGASSPTRPSGSLQAHLVAEAGGPRECHHGHQHLHELQAAAPAVLPARGQRRLHAPQQVLPIAQL